MIRKVVLLWYLIAVTPTVAMAQPPAGEGYGVGMRSCANFAKDYAANTGAAEDVYFTWAQGFMSALNLTTSADHGVYRYIDGAAMDAYKTQIRSFCDEHPLAPYVAAVMEVMKSLPVRKTTSN